MFVDLDDFKAVNDHFGHQARGELLKQIANLLPQQLRTTDSVARGR
jgi:putative two-component system response regulator